jgi:hypothetical protein
MSVFDWFKKPAAIQDDFWGELRFVDGAKQSEGCFECLKLFSPTASQVSCSIDGELPGPTAAQRSFYQKLEAGFDEYAEKIKPLIEEEFRNWKPAFEIKNFTQEFSLVFVSIPRIVNDTPVLWSVALETIHDRNHTIAIDFTDEYPTNILIDG